MPKRPRRPCPGSGPYKGRCPDLINAGERLCERCRKLSYRQQDKDRPSSSKRGYNRHWQRLRLMILRRQPLCSCGCGKPSEEVHHLDGDSSNNDWDNLEALAKACHSKITAKETGWGR